MRATTPVAILASLALLAGCSGKEEKLIGTWKLVSYENTKKPDQKPAECDLALKFQFTNEPAGRKVGGTDGKKLVIIKGMEPCNLKVCRGEPYETAWAVKGGKLQVGTVCFTMNTFSGSVEIEDVTEMQLKLNFFDRLKMTFEKVK